MFSEDNMEYSMKPTSNCMIDRITFVNRTLLFVLAALGFILSSIMSADF